MTVLNKSLAYRIEAMESAHLIWYKHHIPWADNVIESMAKPPTWILDLSMTKYIGDVQKVLRTYVFSEPFERMDEEQHYMDFMASQILRYRGRAISWATLLEAVGRYTDCSDGGDHSCEYFFEMLNDLEDADFCSRLEADQARKIGGDYCGAVESLLPLYSEFRRWYPTQTEGERVDTNRLPAVKSVAP